MNLPKEAGHERKNRKDGKRQGRRYAARGFPAVSGPHPRGRGRTQAGQEKKVDNHKAASRRGLRGTLQGLHGIHGVKRQGRRNKERKKIPLNLFLNPFSIYPFPYSLPLYPALLKERVAGPEIHGKHRGVRRGSREIMTLRMVQESPIISGTLSSCPMAITCAPWQKPLSSFTCLAAISIPFLSWSLAPSISSIMEGGTFTPGTFSLRYRAILADFKSNIPPSILTPVFPASSKNRLNLSMSNIACVWKNLAPASIFFWNLIHSG